MAGVAWQFAGSLAAVAVMVALAWRFGFSGAPKLADEAEARAIAEGLHGGFAATHVALDRQGHGALLRDASGRIALVHPHGAHFVAVLLDRPVPAGARDGSLEVFYSRRSVELDLGPAAAADWAAALDRLG